MIRINLLPDEYRATDRAPWEAIVAGVIGALLVVAAAGHMVWLFAVEIPAAREERDLLAKQERALKPYNVRAEQMHKEVQSARKRQKAILDIRAEKIYWSRKLDLLVGLVPEHIWIERLQLTENPAVRTLRFGQAPSAKIEEGGKLIIAAWSRGDDFNLVKQFKGGLRTHRGFWTDFIRMGDPNFELREVPDAARYAREDRRNAHFTVDLTVRPPLQAKGGGGS